MRICVVGAGYVGLVAATCLADSGHDVVCVDSDQARIQALGGGVVPFYEPGLKELVERNLGEERLAFTTDLEDGVRRSLVIFIAVGTPSAEDGSADLDAVFVVAEGIARAMDSYRILVTKSTVPVGTSGRIRDLVARHTRHEFDVVSNPEFLKEGAAVEDFQRPDRVIVGTRDVRVAEILKELYSPFCRTGRPILVMDPESAELTKYAANALLAARISFMNEVANLCERVGADVNRVREGLGSDTRIGYPFLFPGPGYGGSCFPKDVRALVQTARAHGLELELAAATERVNERQKRVLVEKVLAHFGGEVRGRTVAVWGLAFKPKTDDMREAPAVAVIEGLLEEGARVRAYDPEAMEAARRVFGARVELCPTNYAALEGADALVVVTEWSEFRRPNFDRMKALLASPVVFDGRNIYPPARMRELGYTYYGIGVA
ncbi:MAG: UDP-glucose/GDP-mannose dehydrogenase family protein [Planctomycetes bacterium]|nr:UDP-glucose/GDP-mannose dehydrogenase family protein [Planctomycetota bacterium]